MTFVLQIGELNVGPFETAAHAQQWAERRGIDTWRLLKITAPDDQAACQLGITRRCAL